MYSSESIFDKAISYFKKALDHPDYPSPESAYYNLANAYFKKEDYENSMKYYKQALAIVPNIVILYYKLGEVQVKLKLYQDAISTYQQFDKIYIEDTEGIDKNLAAKIYLQYGLACFKTIQKGQAIAHFKKVVELLPDSPEGLQAKKYLKLLK